MFAGSVNGLGIFRYALTSNEASCLFRFGEYDIHVCQDPDDMFGLFHSMTFLPADRDMPNRRVSSRTCRSALDDLADGATVADATAMCEAASEVPGHCVYSPAAAAPDCTSGYVAGDVSSPSTTCPSECTLTVATADSAESCTAEPIEQSCNSAMGTPAGAAICAAKCKADGFQFMGLELSLIHI